MTDDQSIPLAPTTNGASGRPGDNPPSRPCAGSPVNTHPNSPWNDETIAELKRLYFSAGLSLSQIADEMSTKFHHHFTRNAVMGKVDRKGWEKRGPAPNWRLGRYPAERKPRVRVRKPILPAPPLAPAPIMVEAPTPEPDDCVGTCTLFDLTDSMCHWVTDGKIDGLAAYCGVECQSLEELSVGPYCPEHLARMYKPSTWQAGRVA